MPSNAFETNINPIQSTSGDSLRHISNETGQVYMYLVVETTYLNCTPPKM